MHGEIAHSGKRLSNPSLPVAIRRTPLISAIWAALAPSSRRAYESDYRVFAAFLGQRLEVELDAALALDRFVALPQGQANALAWDYRAFMEAKKDKPTSINRRLASLRKAVEVAAEIGQCSFRLAVKSMKTVPYRSIGDLSLSDFSRICEAAAAQQEPKRSRDLAILRVALALASRRAEVASLDLEDLDLEKSRIAILGKGRREKEPYPLASNARAAVAAWLVYRGSEPGPLFYGLGRGHPWGKRMSGSGLFDLIRRLGRYAGLTNLTTRAPRKIHPHQLRHLAISQCAEMTGGNVFITQTFARHSSPVTTDHYVRRAENAFGNAAEMVDGAAGQTPRKPNDKPDPAPEGA